MTDPALPFIECDQVTAVLAVSDLPAAVEFYVQKLGFQEGFRWGEPPTFAGVMLGKSQLFLTQDTPPPRRNTSSVCFFVGDADRLYAFHKAHGVEITQEIADRSYGIRDYAVRDIDWRGPQRGYAARPASARAGMGTPEPHAGAAHRDGNLLVFGHNLFNAGPPIPIKRVEVPLRLEKRLAALLEDLARHKRMSLASCVEEILLHTNEGVGPHTATTLRVIQELKKKHGIDYDSHASYRFVEEK